jgi:hypothetical protein
MRAARIVSKSSELASGRMPSARDEPENSPRSTRRLRGALLWGGLGFIAGAVFWHLVGFWSFVAEVVLDRTAAAQASVVAPPPASNAVHGVVLVEAARCTTLVLDRRSNLTMALPCSNDGLALRLVPETAVRDDLAALDAPLQDAGYRPD